MKFPFLAFCILLTATYAHAEDRLTYSEIVARLTRLERLAEPIAPGERSGASTSYDRATIYDAGSQTYRNWSANDDGGGSIRAEGDDIVMVDLTGPGVLWRIWSAMPEKGNIRIFLDGNQKPIINKPFSDFFADYERDYPGLAMTLSRGRNAFVPIPFAKSCKVVMAKGWGRYFHATHTQFADPTRVETFTGFTPNVVETLAKASNAWLKRGEDPYKITKTSKKTQRLEIAPGSSGEISIAGSGAVRKLTVEPLGLSGDPIAQEDALREMTLSISWDGETKPSVWAPLGDFFGTSPGLNPFKTLPLGCVNNAFYSHWYMPFSDGMKLVITNDGTSTYKLDVEIESVTLDKIVAKKQLRFCAAWHSDDFTGLDSARFVHKQGDRWPDWPLLVVNGRGRFVGMTQHIWKFGGWWGEGDEKFFVDGEKFPSTIGTGSEDYIGYAWAAEPPFVTFDSAVAACSRLRPDAQEDTSVCRFHLCDDVPFTTRFEGFIEVVPNRDCRPALYDTCVYWYREHAADNPYPIVPMDGRKHQRPNRDMKHVLPITMAPLPTKPGTLEGEDMTVTLTTSGRHWTQEMGGFADGVWSGDSHLIWTDATLGGEIEIEFTVTNAGPQRLVGAFSKALDYGIFELSIDGKRIDRLFDFYDAKVTNTGDIPLGNFDFAPGKHFLHAKAVGRNPNVKVQVTGGHIFGLDYLRLESAEPTQ